MFFNHSGDLIHYKLYHKYIHYIFIVAGRVWTPPFFILPAICFNFIYVYMFFVVKFH